MGKNSVRRFATKKLADFTILESDGTVCGRVRVKPSTIAWKGKGDHKWSGVTLEEFGEFCKSKGVKKKK